MYPERLAALEREGQKIRVALVGAGAMGVGIAWQIGRTPGMELVSVTDTNIDAALHAVRAYSSEPCLIKAGQSVPGDGHVAVTSDPFFLLKKDSGFNIEVLVESTNTLNFAGRLCLEAIEQNIHVILMNAEIDLALGCLLHQRAVQNNVIVTSDAGDQHGVLMHMIEEIQMWNFRIVMAGNIKGFLDRYATAKSVAHEARVRNLNPVQCCAYTDGTKLAIEMALIGNGANLTPWVTGMEGPRAHDISEVFQVFDFRRYGETGVVDYILGANPGGGVFVVGYCDDPIQVPYLKYYKLGEGPYYLFIRPYHLCHLETPGAIASVMLDHQAIMWPKYGRINDVYAYAKCKLSAGEVIPHAIGGDTFYGLIEKTSEADTRGGVPVWILDSDTGLLPKMKRSLLKDQPLSWEDIELPDSFLTSAFNLQKKNPLVDPLPGAPHSHG